MVLKGQLNLLKFLARILLQKVREMQKFLIKLPVQEAAPKI